MTGVPVEDAVLPRFSHREVLVILSGVLLGMFLAALDQMIVATALPALSAELGGIEHLSWVVSAYLLTSTAATPIYGKLSDLYGRRLMLQSAIAIFLAASVLCALAATMAQLIVFRALQGLGGGGLFAMAHATIGDIVAPRERGRYQGYIASMFAVASVAGPVLGGLFVDHLSWRWVFWINLPFGLTALLICSRALRRLTVRRMRHRIDWQGAALLVAAVTCALLVTVWGGTALAWTSPVILGLAAAGAVLLLLFVLQERAAAEPILAPRLFRNPVYTVGNLIAFFAAMAMIGAIVFLPLFLQLVLGVSAGHSGLLLIPLTAAIVTGATFSGQRITRTGRYRIYPAIGLLLATAGLLLMAARAAAADRGVMIALMVPVGVGIGMALPVVLVAIQNAVAPGDMGTGTASVSFFRSLGGSFGVAVLGSILIARINHAIGGLPGHETLGLGAGIELLRGGPAAVAALPETARAVVVAAVAGSFRAVFLVAAGFTALGLGAALFLRELPLRSDAASGAAVTPDAAVPSASRGADALGG